LRCIGKYLDFALTDLELSIRIISERPMVDEELMRFCTATKSSLDCLEVKLGVRAFLKSKKR